MNITNNENQTNASDYTVAEMINGNNDKHAGLIKALKSLKDILPDLMDFPVLMPDSMR